MRLKSESGQEFILREVSACDSEPLGQYFESLSAETRKRYGPHPFTKEFAVELCTRKHDSAIRYVLTLAENKRFVGYFILEFRMSEELLNRYREQGIDLSDGKNPLFAPSIADDYQNTGLASLAMPDLIKSAKNLGAKSLVLMGGTQATNKRAIAFYEKFGFKHVCEFETKVLNYDMWLVLG